MLGTWELPAALSKYSAEGHISNEGEDLVKRIWDLFSELGTRATAQIQRDGGAPPGKDPQPGRDFDRHAAPLSLSDYPLLFVAKYFWISTGTLSLTIPFFLFAKYFCCK